MRRQGGDARPGTAFPRAMWVAELVAAALLAAATVGILRFVAARRPPTIALVVLDTVRADHTSLCGYERPTTPFLRELVAGGAVHSCRAYAPAGWTLPSHVSYLSGVPPSEHGADFDDTAPARTLAGWTGSARLVPSDLPLLAEELGAAGYETALLAENPILVPAGLGRGFATISTSSSFPATDAVPRLDALLEALDPRRPLFLVVNLMSAHAPWAPVPDGVGWVPTRNQQSQEEARRILDPSTSPHERDALVRWRTDLYDYGVSRADDGVRRVFAALRAHDRLPPGSRVVVVSDHGEFLGEHGRIDHAEELYEPQQRVPLLVWGIEPLRLPEPVSGMVVYGLLRNGRLASELPPVVATQARRHDVWSDGLADPPRASAAQWTDTGKHILVGDAAVHFDLSTDPHELSGRPIDDGDRAAVDLRSALAAVRGAGRETSADLTKTLRALGYVE